MEQINLTNRNEDFAVFLPAISGIYAKFMSDYQANKLPPERIPQGLPKGLDSLKFLNENGIVIETIKRKWSYALISRICINPNFK
mgnify:CR=1 FL=1